MTEIEKKLVEAGWTAEGRRPERRPPIRSMPTISNLSCSTQSMFRPPPSSPSMASWTRPRRIPAQSRQMPGASCKRTQALRHQQLLDLVIARLGVLAEQFVDRGRFATALELTQDVIKVAPARYQLHAIRAHAMMFLGREDDGRQFTRTIADKKSVANYGNRGGCGFQEIQPSRTLTPADAQDRAPV